ncbi:MAG: pyridoxal phosphate-dependent aminotransferase [Arenicellales bacterium WSBS_2016_MAG_OTU3]
MQDPVLASRVNKIQPSATIAVSMRAQELRAEGKDIISLSAGEPDFDTPEHIKNAARKALNAGQTKYTAVDGTVELKRAIMEKFSRENHLNYEANQILVSVGAKHSIFNLLMATIEAGDEVIIPAPYWVSYSDMVALVGGKPVVVMAGLDQGFKITPQQLEAAITPNTKMMLLNSPSNPTGTGYSRADLAALGKVLKKHPKILIASDDIYEHIIWNEEGFVNILNACPELYHQTIIINGVSKAYSMTGWRIGYAAGNAHIIGAMKKLQSQSTSNPNSIAQAASVEAIAGDQSCVTEMVTAFKQRHDYVVKTLNQIDGIQCAKGDGTFYAFPDVSGAVKKVGVKNDTELATYLLDKAEVAMVPGAAFGAPGYLRMSFATDMGSLETALNRVGEVLSS